MAAMFKPVMFKTLTRNPVQRRPKAAIPPRVPPALPAIDIGKRWTVVREAKPELVIWNRLEPMQVVRGYVQFTGNEPQTDGTMLKTHVQVVYGGSEQIRVTQSGKETDLWCIYEAEFGRSLIWIPMMSLLRIQILRCDLRFTGLLKALTAVNMTMLFEAGPQ